MSLESRIQQLEYENRQLRKQLEEAYKKINGLEINRLEWIKSINTEIKTL